MSSTFRTIVLAVAAALLAVPVAAQQALDAEAFQSDVRTLTASPNRLAGFENGSIAASRHVEKRLRDMGYSDQELFIQSFPVVMPVYTESTITVDGETLDIEPVRPNLLQATVTPADGLTGRTLYAGKGNLADYGSELPEDRIVVIDFDCDERWLNAFAFGARAVIFVSDDGNSANAYQHVNTPSNLPRFYMPRSQAEKLGLLGAPKVVTLKAACDWKQLRGRNVIAVLRGTEPSYTDDLRQAVVLAAPLDSFSEVPNLAPGARQAANVAALLQTAQLLKANPPKRDVVIAFFDGESQCHLGSRAFYGSLYRRKGSAKYADHTLEDRIASLQKERGYIEKVVERFSNDSTRVFEDTGDGTLAPATLLLQHEIRQVNSDVLDELRPLRVKRAEVERQLKRTEDPSLKKELQDQLDTLRVHEIHLAVEDLVWNTIERVTFEKKNIADEEYRRNELLVKISDEVPENLPPGEPAVSQRQRVNDLLSKRFQTALDRVVRVYSERIEVIDQLIEESRQAMALRDAIGSTKSHIVLHISYNLGDARARWTFIHGDDTVAEGDDTSGEYGSIFGAMREVAKSGEFPGFDVRPVGELYENRLFAPGLIADSSAMARIFAIRNVSLFTSLDRLDREGRPADTLEALDLNAMEAQAAEALPFVASLIDRNGLNVGSTVRPQVTYAEGEFAGPNRNNGPSVKRTGGGSAMADQPVRGAVVAMVRPKGGYWAGAEVTKVPPGFNYPYIVMTSTNGVYEVGPYSNSRTEGYYRPVLFAASFDKPPVLDLIENPQAIDRSRGLITSTTSTKTLVTSLRLTNYAIQMFKCRSKTVVGWGYDRAGIPTKALRALSSSAFREDAFLLVESGKVISLFAPYDAKGFKLHCKTGPWLLNNRLSPDLYEGQGISLDDQFDHPFTSRWSAHDLQVLNQQRLDMLRAVRITQESLEEINSTARDLQEDGLAKMTFADGQSPEDAMPSDKGTLNVRLDKFAGDLESSAAYSRGAYTPLIGTMNDLVTAVVLLLLLAMPFAFALERLLIGSPHIYRQIGWFAVFFIITFAVLFFVNPAFRIAATPMIIFLAFTIILLSALVIFIMVRKLQTEIKKMQGLATTVHSADVSRLSTMMAAVSMGISTMRRRPVRTLLTAATVVLLTFTILTFASFGSRWGIRDRYEGPMNGATERALVRHQLWSPIPDDLFELIGGHFGDDATVAPRYWISPTAAEVQAGEGRELMVSTDNIDQLVPLAGAIGIDLRDMERQEELGDLFIGDTKLLARDGVFLTATVRDTLGLSDADIGKAKVLVKGRAMTFAGTLSERAATFPMLESSSILPVDYQSSGNREQAQNTGEARAEMPDVESAQFVRYNVDRVVVVPAQAAKEMGGQLRSITIYSADPQKLEDLAKRSAILTQLPVYVGKQGAVNRLIFASLTEASGWQDLMIPVILGGLIIFATMLGSVSDREREIYTFSSLGLAPPHVASLFFAEASIYAVVGGMGGYLLGQAVARLLGWLSGMGLVPVIEMNYSSTNAIVTVLIVMCTVLISTIYPAVKASRSANPGIQRSWQIPKPEGNLYDLTFPFTVSAYDIIGVVSFLREHFDNFSDASLGVFATMECHVFRQQGNDMLGFRARVALAPLDLGVTQEFAMLSQPSEIEGIDEVRILIHRLSGAHGDWQRSNRVFINDLRKQLLIWRSLPHEVMDSYRQRTLDQWDDLAVEDVNAQSIGGTA